MTMRRGRGSVSDEICRTLLEKINKEEIVVGEKLPSENELCCTFGVSRTSVRAALQTLQARGLVVTVKGLGSFVYQKEEILAHRRKKPFKSSDITSEKFQEFFEFRQAIEFKAIDFFVKRADSSNERDLKQALDGIKLAAKNKDLKKFSKMDYAFHMAIIQGAKNSFLSGAMQEYEEMFQHYLAEIARLSDKPLTVLAREHNELYTSLIKKKAKAAKSFLFSDNMFYFMQYFSKWMEELNGRP